MCIEAVREYRAFCSVCGREVQPAPARFDGEFTLCGWYPCPDHPYAKLQDKPKTRLCRYQPIPCLDPASLSCDKCPISTAQVPVMPRGER
jgi:hypothetical protein